MIRRLLAVAFIFLCTSAAWGILSATIYSRTQSQDSSLRGTIATNWGSPQEASPPIAQFSHKETHKNMTKVDGRIVETEVESLVVTPLPLDASHLNVALDLEHRQKGLMWYSTYRVSFAGTYAYRNPSAQHEQVTFRLRLPAANAIYDGLQIAIDGRALDVANQGNTAIASTDVAPNATVQLAVAYRSQGLDTWRYQFGGGEGAAQAREFSLKVRTNFADIDFAENGLSPTEKHATSAGWDLAWSYKNLVTACQIGIVMPQKAQPGPLAGEISMFAPVSLFFFFFVMLMVTTIRRIDLHPMNYFFLAAAFFAFHLLMAYLVDHISIHWAFAICSVVSVFLVITYLRLVAGLRFAAVIAGGAQLVYLVLFSYAFFFRGYTGLTVTIGAIATLFITMQLTGRVRWSQQGTSQEPPAIPSGLTT
jgi:inner membrane protein involved in colicin E2 resistance